MITLTNLGIYNFLIRIFIKLGEICTRVIDKLLIAENNGVHPKHKLMRYHEFFVDNIEKNSYILDIGCGIGAVTFDIAKNAKKIIGVDLSAKNIELSKKKFNAENIKYLVADATKYNFNENFNYIILSNVLEHIEDRISFLNKIKKLAPSILIRIPMINRDWITIYKKELGIEWRSDKTHYTEYTLESFRDELRKAGLKLEKYSIQFGEIWGVIK